MNQNVKRRARILVVDDEAAIRLFLRQTLEDLGHEVFEAVSGREALERARQEHPDLILLDLMIPVVPGIEVCRQLRADAQTREMCIIAVSGLDGRQGMEESIVAGADDFLAKPVNALELSVRVRSMLRVRNIHDEEQRVEAYVRTLQRLREREV